MITAGALVHALMRLSPDAEVRIFRTPAGNGRSEGNLDELRVFGSGSAVVSDLTTPLANIPIGRLRVDECQDGRATFLRPADRPALGRPNTLRVNMQEGEIGDRHVRVTVLDGNGRRIGYAGISLWDSGEHAVNVFLWNEGLSPSERTLLDGTYTIDGTP